MKNVLFSLLEIGKINIIKVLHSHITWNASPDHKISDFIETSRFSYDEFQNNKKLLTKIANIYNIVRPELQIIFKKKKGDKNVMKSFIVKVVASYIICSCSTSFLPLLMKLPMQLVTTIMHTTFKLTHKCW